MTNFETRVATSDTAIVAGLRRRDKVGELFVHLDEPNELAILLVIDAIALSGRAGRGRLQSRQFGAVDSALLLQPVFDLAN